MHDDKFVPIYDVRNTGCTYSETFRVLLDGDANYIYTKQPILVENNYLFLVDLMTLMILRVMIVGTGYIMVKNSSKL